MQNYLVFFTATILNWQKLLENDNYKQIICDSLKFLVANKRVCIYGFVVMPNHVHIIWKIYEPYKASDVQRDFLKFTAQQIKADLEKACPHLLKNFESNASDRYYQFWERRAYSSRLFNRQVVEQKLNYIHSNPLNERWKLCLSEEDYKFSSAAFYNNKNTIFDFITDYRDGI